MLRSWSSQRPKTLYSTHTLAFIQNFEHCTTFMDLASAMQADTNDHTINTHT